MLAYKHSLLNRIIVLFLRVLATILILSLSVGLTVLDNLTLPDDKGCLLLES